MKALPACYPYGFDDCSPFGGMDPFYFPRGGGCMPRWGGYGLRPWGGGGYGNDFFNLYANPWGYGMGFGGPGFQFGMHSGPWGNGFNFGFNDYFGCF